MSKRIRKCADSNDPRDWTYLTKWQSWGSYMPAWNWSFQAPLTFSVGGAPFFDSPLVLNKGISGLGSDGVTWLEFLTLPIPEIGEVPVWFFNVSLTTFAQDGSLTDGMGNVQTLGISGLFALSITALSTIAATFNGTWLNPNYDADFVMPISNSLPTPFPQFADNITLRPIKWDVPATI